MLIVDCGVWFVAWCSLRVGRCSNLVVRLVLCDGCLFAVCRVLVFLCCSQYVVSCRCRLFVAGCYVVSLFVVRCVLCVAWFSSLFSISRSLFVVSCSLLVVCCSWFVYVLPFVVCCVLFIGRCSLLFVVCCLVSVVRIYLLFYCSLCVAVCSSLFAIRCLVSAVNRLLLSVIVLSPLSIVCGLLHVVCCLLFVGR